MSVPVTLALGANLHDPRGQLQRAVAGLANVIRIEATSSVYLTEPVGGVHQPDYYNIVLAGETDAPVYTLHDELHRIEAEMGRERRERNGPRTIDIDLIAYGDLALRAPDLTVPHPRYAERSFVLEPLMEIAPGWRDPVDGRAIADIVAGLREPSRIQRLDAL